MATKSDKFNKHYLCIGENYKDTVPMGDCGDTRTLRGWLKHLFPNAKVNLEEYFRYYRPAEIAEYIYKNVGKNLKEVK